MSSELDNTYPLVKMGSETFPLIPQPVGTLTRRLQRYAEPIYAAVQSGEIDVESLGSVDAFVRGGLTKVHELLAIFYPQMTREPVGGGAAPMPFWKFDGWASEAAWRERLEDGDGDGGPTIPEIKHALLSGLKANDLDSIRELRDAIPFDGVKTWARGRIASSLEADLAKGSRSLVSSTAS